MNRGKPHGLAALTALSVLMVILLVAGCGAIGSSGSSVLDAGRSSDTASTIQRVKAADDGIAGCTALLGGPSPLPVTTRGSVPSSRAHNCRTSASPARLMSILSSSCGLRGLTDMRPSGSTSGYLPPVSGTAGNSHRQAANE